MFAWSRFVTKFWFLTIFMVSMDGFLGGGITRDGLELVGERYGVYSFNFGSLSSVLLTCCWLIHVNMRSF